VEVLARFDRGTLIEHIPELLEGLCQWLEGRVEGARTTFATIAECRAVERLGYGIELPIVNVEFACLRKVLMQHVLTVFPLPPAEQVHSINDGIDEASRLMTRAYVKQRDRLRDRFIGMLGHDLRNPLGVVSMSTQLLFTSESLDAQDRKRVQAIARAAERMGRMVRDVLDFASASLGPGIPISPTECDLGHICRAVVEELSLTHPDRELNVVGDGRLTANVDYDRAFQAIGNLISNAIQHGEDPITVTVVNDPGRASITTAVTNRGQPIGPEAMRSIFDPFFNGLNPRKNGRLGLGLYIVAEIARSHGATCAVETSDSEHTTFVIRWPCAPPLQL